MTSETRYDGFGSYQVDVPEMLGLDVVPTYDPWRTQARVQAALRLAQAVRVSTGEDLLSHDKWEMRQDYVESVRALGSVATISS